MKILVVSHIPTHPVNEGNRSCISAYVGMLRGLGHRVELLYLHMPWATREPLDAMRSWWGNGFHQFTQSGLDRFVQLVHHKLVFRLLGRYTLDSHLPIAAKDLVRKLVASEGFDAVLVNYWCYSGLLEGLPDSVRKVVYAHDLFADRFRRTGGDWLSTDAATEGRAFDRADAVLAIQADEAQDFARRTKSRVLVAYSHFPPRPLSPSGTRDLLFLASANPNNVHGIRGFIVSVLPRIVASIPAARLLVGGRVCRALGDLSETPGLVLQGDVDDLAAFYAQGDVVVNPVSLGSGLKIKTFEALAFGRAVVSDPHGTEGIFDAARAPVRVATTPEDYLRVVEELLLEPGVLEATCRNSLDYVERMNRQVESAFQEALGVGPDVGVS